MTAVGMRVFQGSLLAGALQVAASCFIVVSAGLASPMVRPT
jgi:hypothetical protein